jgi:ribosomal protein S18 acetylase RimI-like enzyme
MERKVSSEIDLKIQPISRRFLESSLNIFIQIDRVIKTDNWVAENFLSELPQKWDLSLAALLDDAIIGFLIASRKKESLHIHRLAVKHEYQSKGVGKMLLLELLTLGEKYAMPTTLKVDCSNEGAINFYKRLGFNVQSRNGNNFEMRNK